MNKTKIVSLSILLITLFCTNCFATTNELKIHEINKTVPLEEVEQFRKNIQNEITIDNAKYELQNVSEYENKETKTQEKEEVKQKVVNTNNKYDVLNMFESKIEMTEDKMSGILELQNHSLDLKVNDSYIEQYKVSLTIITCGSTIPLSGITDFTIISLPLLHLTPLKAIKNIIINKGLYILLLLRIKHFIFI